MKESKRTANNERILNEVRRAVTNNEKLTCAQLAQRLDIVPSTVIKAARKMGFSGWNDMYYSLSQRYSEALPLSIDSMGVFGDGRLFEKIRQLTEELLDHKEKSLMVASVGDSEFLADYLLDMLWKRGFRPIRLSTPIRHEAVEGNVAPGLCLFINESGMALYEVGNKLAEAGWKIAAVTSSSDTPLAGIAAISVELRNRKSPVDSYLPNFFAARVQIFLELLFAEMDAILNQPIGK